MRPDGTLVGTYWGPLSAIAPQPRRRHANEVRVHAPTEPWGSHRLPRTLAPGDPRRTLFRSLLRRAEGVPVEFADGETGIVEEVVFPALGFDFWPTEFVVATADGLHRVPVGRVRRIDVRRPRVVVAVSSHEPLERGDRRQDERGGDEHRLHRRHDLVQVRVLPADTGNRTRRRQAAVSPRSRQRARRRPARDHPLRSDC